MRIIMFVNYKVVVLSMTLFFLSASLSYAQNENTLITDSIIELDSEKKWVGDMAFQFKTMNVFRGVLPSRAPVLSTQAGVKYKSLIMGFYGGSSFNGGYTETDFILIYYKPKFDIHLEWYYNFTEGITNIPTPSGFFDFNPETTRGLLDFIFNYDITNHFKVTSSTLLFGRDRPALSEDLANDIQLRRGPQRYSQYLEFSYYWYLNKTKVVSHVGGSFSWVNFNGETFYGNRPGFNDIGITFYHKLFNTENFSIPIKASISVNTLSNNVYLMAGVQLLELTKIK